MPLMPVPDPSRLRNALVLLRRCCSSGIMPLKGGPEKALSPESSLQTHRGGMKVVPKHVNTKILVLACPSQSAHAKKHTEMQAKLCCPTQERDCVPAERTEMQAKRGVNTQERDCVPQERSKMQAKPTIWLIPPLLLYYYKRAGDRLFWEGFCGGEGCPLQSAAF